MRDAQWRSRFGDGYGIDGSGEMKKCGFYLKYVQVVTEYGVWRLREWSEWHCHKLKSERARKMSDMEMNRWFGTDQMWQTKDLACGSHGMRSLNKHI